ncbi:DUF4136 domain-containing protein [Pseudoalteromonas fenneropenaei]|uniref:DUF4136 domain-containing protein n=1 Tax=Pseudoalteromonas fenneropenaei TaxID=1737459 RepID=A0ABV7CQ92_9GAMM
MKRLLSAALLVLLAGCAKTPDWDYDKSVQFSNYKTYAFAPDANISNMAPHYQVNDLMEKRLRSAISSEMGKQGFNATEPNQADMLVNYHVSVDKEIVSDTIDTMYTAHWSHWGWGVRSRTTVQEYDVGTIIVDIIDKNAQQLVWRGVKEGRLRKNQTPEQRTETINKTVAEILANFPPKAL